MNEIHKAGLRYSKLMCLLLAFIPIFIGLISLVNNIQMYTMTMTRIVYPLLRMSYVDSSFHVLRMIESPILAHLAYISLTLGEFLISLIALFGACRLIWGKTAYSNAIWYIQFACIWGVFVWGFGFFTISDFFLVWQTKELKSLQPASLQYVVLMFIVAYSLELLKRHLCNDNSEKF